MTLRTVKSYDLKPTVFTRDSMFSVAELLDQRARQLVAAEATARENADVAIVNEFNAKVQAITAELGRVRLLAESLGDAELAQLEDSLLQVLQQPAFQELLSGGSLEGFKLNSIVLALASQPDEAYIERSNPIHGVATVIKMGFTDGRSSILSAELTSIAADAEAGTPERIRFDYRTENFLGLPAVQTVLFNVFRFTGSDKLWLEEVRRDLVLFDLTAQFLAAGPAPVLQTPDLNTDGVIGLGTPVDPVAVARKALDDALAAKIYATTNREAADAAVTAAETLASQRQSAYEQLQVDSAQYVISATELVDSETISRNAAAAAVTAAEQALADAESSGDADAIQAAAVALADKRDLLVAAEQALTDATNALATLNNSLNAARIAAESAAADVPAKVQAATLAVQVEVAAVQAVAAAQQAYDAAVAAATPTPVPAG